MEDVLKIKKELEKTIPGNDSRRALELLRSLEGIPMSLDVLHKTHIGMTVNKIRKSVENSEVSSLSKVMVKKWKKLLSSEKPAAGTVSSAANPSVTNNTTTTAATATTTATTTTSTPTATATNTSSNINNSQNQSQANHQQLSREQQNSLAAAGDSALANRHQMSSNHHHQHHASSHHTTPARGDSSPVQAPASANQHHHKQQHAAPMQTEVPATTSEVRLKCRQLLTDALKKPLPKEMSHEAFLEEDILAARIEECIHQEFKTTDMKYKNRVRSRVSNLGDSKNPYLRLNVLRGDLAPEKIAKMSAEDMASDELKKERERFTKEAINDHQMTFTSGTKTSEIKCPACKKYDVTYNQVQTRSADEPMTTFCYCNLCGKRWKFC